MKMPDVRQKARTLGITPGKMKKVDLIRAIQATEENPQCYGNSNGRCDQMDCCFRTDCLKTNGSLSCVGAV